MEAGEVAAEIGVRDGVWFLRTGEAVFIEETKFRDAGEAPFRILKRLLSSLLADTSAVDLPVEVFNASVVREWINANSPPDGEARVMEWYAQLSDVCIRCGLSLLWRGKLTTSIPDLAQVCAAVQSCEETVSRLRWPAESLILVTTIADTAEPKSEHISLGLLTGERFLEAVELPPDGQSPAAQEPPKSPADALNVIKSLLDQGLISGDEFAAKRAEILSRI